MSDNFDLTPAEWTALRQLLDQALAVAPAEREAWVERLDASRDVFKPRLRALLAHAAREVLPVDTLPSVDPGRLLADDALSDEDALQPGTVVGPYRLIRPLGEGGMGTVWLAERTDMLHKRQVALKLPRLVTGRARLAQRLEREREIVAALNHPNIARLYDAGLADGQPWLAFEYVEGERIDVYGQRKRLDVAAKLSLFLQVARAVAHAHANLVVHRDLKPSNILVTEQGDVRLLDFGIAKLLEGGRAEETELTQLGGRALTPDYAAPEQILGQPISTATDVYALGVLLYDLLTGMRPYKLKRDSRAALEEAILQADVQRPSDTVSDRLLRRRLRGDLDTIVLKALKKEPAARYGTVQALAEDIERHLTDRPVQALPDSRLYRLRKLVARNKLAMGAAAAVFVALIAGASVAVWQAYEARTQRDAAVQQQRRAEAHNEFLHLMLESIGAGGKPLTLPELLDRGVELLDADTGIDAELAGNLSFDMAQRYATIGRSDKQLELLERAVASARRLGDDQLLASAQCTAALALLGRDGGAARARLAEGEAVLPRVVHPHISTELACLRARAFVQRADGETDRAIATLRSALGRLQQSPVPYSGLQISLMTDLGDLYFQSDRVAEALDLTAETLALLDRSGRGATMSRVVTALNYAAVLSRAGEVVAAAEAQRRALEIARGFDGARGLPPGFASHLAGSLVRLAQYDEALPLIEEDLQSASDSGNKRAAAVAELMLGGALVKLGRFDEAEGHLAHAEQTLRADPSGNARLLNEIALTRADRLLRSARPKEAATLVAAVLEGLGYPSRRTAPGLGGALSVGARVALANAEAAQAEQLATDGLGAATAAARDPRRSANVGQALLLRARARQMQDLEEPARQDAAEAVVALSAGLGPDHPETSEAREVLSSLK